MTKDAVFAVIANSQKCAIEDITLDKRLDEMGIDSLRAITILYELEEQFGIEIPNEMIESVTTVGDIVDGLERLRRPTVEE
ncbi:MAG TPA: acyl carrier protein [Gammaproteobacteria bacterium]|nr:acyl carrier protein [Gammaproteobacteria bacterium]